jgi:formate-dependent nitrite reductase cytochrome c552 subunit
MHIGGGAAGQGGIHSWHIDPNKQTIYIAADAQRQIIPWVQVREANGRVTEFVARDAPLTPDQLARAERRVMDCMDCHNRPTHIFRLPDRAMDEALALGRIDRTLPYIKKLGVEVLRAAAEVQSDAPEEIARRVRSFYGEKYPELFRSRREAIEAAIRELQAIYRRNVFPSMRVTWGTYPDHLGHTTFPGCFRCHDEQHVSADGRTISQSCDLCHTLLAIEEPNPPILQQLNIR